MILSQIYLQTERNVGKSANTDQEGEGQTVMIKICACHFVQFCRWRVWKRVVSWFCSFSFIHLHTIKYVMPNILYSFSWKRHVIYILKCISRMFEVDTKYSCNKGVERKPTVKRAKLSYLSMRAGSMQGHGVAVKIVPPIKTVHVSRPTRMSGLWTNRGYVGHKGRADDPKGRKVWRSVYRSSAG